MELSQDAITKIGNIMNIVIDSNCIGDLSLYFIDCILQKLYENQIDKDSAEKLLEYNLFSEPYEIEQIYDKGKVRCDTPIHKLCDLNLHKTLTSPEDWKKIENDIDQAIHNCVFEETREITYKMDSNNYIIINKEECLVYEETENTKNKSDDNYRKIVLGAIPTNVIIYKNPLLAEVSKYQIDWVSKTAVAPFKMEALPFTQIYEYLREHNLILDSRRGKDVVSRVLFAMERAGDVETDNSVTNPGIFYVPFDQKIVTRNLDIIENVSYLEEIEALEFLDKYASYFPTQELKLGTVLKWGWMAPFSFAIKQLNYEWMPWLFLYGKAGSGKTEGYGYPTIYMYDTPNQTVNDIGGSSIDTVARLGYRMQQGTKTILVNEPGTLFKKPSTCDMLKNCVTSITSRGKFQDYNNYTTIPSYSVMFITANNAMPNDESLRRRFIIMNCTRDESTRDTRREFIDEMKPTQYETSPLNKLKVISGLVVKRIKEEPDLLSDWKLAIDTILGDIYTQHNMIIPNWLQNWYEEESPEDIDQEKINIIQESLKKIIVDVYSKVNGGIGIDNTPLSEVLDCVIDSQLVPWVRFKNRKCDLVEHEIAFSTGFIRYINKQYAEEETLPDIAQLLGWDYRRSIYCFNSPGIYVTRDALLEFLFPGQEDWFYKERYPSQESTQ